MNSPVGTKATIKTVYTPLCGEPSGTAYANQSAWTNVSNFTNRYIWAEVGWYNSRNDGTDNAPKSTFGELGYAKDTSIFVFGPIPNPDSTHTYECDLTNSATGTWTYYVDGVSIGTITHPEWINQAGTVVEYEGEVSNLEDHMPGTTSDKCLFSPCQYKIAGGAYQNAGITSSQVTSDDNTKYGAQWLSGIAFQIWDKRL